MVSSSVIGGGDIGDGNVWDGATVAAAIAAAGDAIASGDLLRIGASKELFRYTAPETEGVGYYLLPSAVGAVGAVAPGTLWSGFRSIDPVGVVDDWDHVGESGSPTYDVSGGVLTIDTPASGDGAWVSLNTGSRPASPVLAVIEDLSCVAAAALAIDRPYIQIRLDDSDRLVRIRPQGTSPTSAWGIATTGSDVAMTGTQIGTPTTIELRVVASSPGVLQWRENRTGAWSTISAALTTTGGTYSVVMRSAYSTAAQSLSLRSFHLVEL